MQRSDRRCSTFRNTAGKIRISRRIRLTPWKRVPVKNVSRKNLTNPKSRRISKGRNLMKSVRPGTAPRSDILYLYSRRAGCDDERGGRGAQEVQPLRHAPETCGKARRQYR